MSLPTSENFCFVLHPFMRIIISVGDSLFFAVLLHHHVKVIHSYLTFDLNFDPSPMGQ